MDIERRFPCVADMRRTASRRIPKFAFDYLDNGIGSNLALRNNRNSLDRVKLVPRYLVEKSYVPECYASILGQSFSQPFGVAPIGLGGIIWPNVAQHLAEASRASNIPFCLSGFATALIEDIQDIAGENAWYQHYMCTDDDLNRKMFRRAQACGYRTLVITVDIPTATRRDHDIRNGLSVPPRFNPGTLWQILKRPKWMMETVRHGIPRFQNYAEVIPRNANLDQLGLYIQELIEGHVTGDRLRMVRDLWPHRLVAKGVLGTEDAIDCKAIGLDALVISNHGGRQLDAAHSPSERLRTIREAVGPGMPILVDGGVATGLDIARYIALGADFVLAGRAFMYAVAAMGKAGAGHVIDILSRELRMTMSQLGCTRVEDLPKFLDSPYDP